MEIKDRIRIVRKERGYTQQEFAAQIGSTQSNIASYETGRINPSATVINNICKTFTINEDWLRYGAGSMTAATNNSAIERLKARQNGQAPSYNLLDSLLPMLPTRDNVVYLRDELLHDFPAHTFKQRSDRDKYTRGLLNSIRGSGILEPLIVRPHPTLSSEYEIIAGHTRRRLGRQAGLVEFPCLIIALGDDEAVSVMAESNIQRPGWLPSERARTYKAYFDAAKRRWSKKPGRPKSGTEIPNSDGGRLREAVAKTFGVSDKTLEIYMRLCALVPSLMDMVDDGRVSVKAGYHLATLPLHKQEALSRLLTQYSHIKVNESTSIDLIKCECEQWHKTLCLDAVKEKKPSTYKSAIPLIDDELPCSVCKAKDYLAEAEFEARVKALAYEYIAERAAKTTE